MEEYLQYMRTLRSQMNDVEDQAAKISVEEQTHITAIQTMEKDLTSSKSKTKQLKEDAELMIKLKGEICSQILDKQRKIASLESDSYTLLQTLELIQRERVSLSAKIMEKRDYYTKVADDINSKLQQQQDWVNSHRVSGDMEEHALEKVKVADQTAETEGKFFIDNNLSIGNLGNHARNNLMALLDSARAKLGEIAGVKARLVAENTKMKQSIELVKRRAKDFKPELVAMDIKDLEEEYKALSSDKAGEFEYLQSLQQQIEKLKGISHMIRCVCGTEYNVAMDHCA